MCWLFHLSRYYQVHGTLPPDWHAAHDRWIGKDAKDSRIYGVVLQATRQLATITYKSQKTSGKDLLNAIEHFFKHFKDLESGKWVKIDGWEGIDSARKEILSSIDRYKEKVAA